MKRMFKTLALVAIATLALTGCYKHNPIDRNDGRDPHEGGGRTDEKLVVNERSDWSIRYIAREDWVNDDGSVDRVEHFEMKYTGSDYYIVRIIRPADLKNAYDNDLADFFTYEAESLVSDAEKDNVNFYNYTDEVFTSRITTIYFNRLRSDTWIAFLVELDKSGKPTGSYAEADFSIKQEEASEAYNQWLGNWLVSNGKVGYELAVTALDNNYLYRVDGWECGDAAGNFQMDQEYLETEFWSGNMYFTSQYLGTYDDQDFGYGTVDELFMGNIFDSNGITIITDEGLDLAVAVLTEDGADLVPGEVTLNTDNGEYTTTFDSMQYYMWAHSTGEWHPYHDSVAKLPLTMTRLRGTRSTGYELAPERTATKASIHHAQPKAGASGRKTVAKKAVRMK